MSNSYYYFAASLPLLYFDGRNALSTKNFLAECRRLLAQEDFADIAVALGEEREGADGHNPLLKEWLGFENNLKNEIAWARSLEMKKDPLAHVRGERYPEPLLVEAVAQSVKNQDLLDAERSLDRLRWRFLNDLEQGHAFDLEFVLIYGLKLKILERYKEIDSDKGKELFEEYQKTDIPQLNAV